MARHKLFIREVANEGAKCTYRQKWTIHNLQLVTRGLDPALRPECIDVWPKDIRILGQDECVHANDGAGGDVDAAECSATFGHDPLEWESNGWVDAEGFFDYGLAVWWPIYLAVAGRAFDWIRYFNARRERVQMLKGVGLDWARNWAHVQIWQFEWFVILDDRR